MMTSMFAVVKVRNTSNGVSNRMASFNFDKYLYIDAKNGDDTTGDGTENNPFKTLNRIATTGVIETGYSYGVILADGHYDMTASLFTLNCDDSIHIWGNNERTVIDVKNVIVATSGNYTINLYECVWNVATTDYNVLQIYSDVFLNFYNVVITATNYIPWDCFHSGHYNFYNCTNAASYNRRSFYRAVYYLENCYGNWNVDSNYTQTCYITSTPQLSDTYEITDDDSVWVGTGENEDGSPTDLGVYGGEYAWVPRKRYQINYRNEYIKAGTTLALEITETTGQVANPNEADWAWTSSNTDVATVNGNGVITGVSMGETTITGYNAAESSKFRVIVHVYRNKTGSVTVPDIKTGTQNAGYTIILKEDGTVWRGWL